MNKLPLLNYVELHLDPRTSLSKSCLLTCKELELDERNYIGYEVQSVDLAAKEHKSERHLKLHPFGKVPVLVTDRITLYEGQAILRYLATHIPPRCPSGREVHLIPRNPHLKAQMNKLMSICPSYFKPAWFPMYKELVLKKRYNSPDPVDEKTVQQSMEDTAGVLDVLEMEMRRTKGGYFCGKNVSLCDLYLFPELLCLEEALKFDELLQGRPFLGAWFRRMTDRRSWQKVSKYNIKIGHKYERWRVRDHHDSDNMGKRGWNAAGCKKLKPPQGMTWEEAYGDKKVESPNVEVTTQEAKEQPPQEEKQEPPK